jgi:hypothetical protein
MPDPTDFNDRLRAEVAHRQSAAIRRLFGPSPPDDPAPGAPRVSAAAGTQVPRTPDSPVTFDDIVRYLARS